ncbi:MAG TPA: hypothetical protein VGR87_11370 [Candidatus Limnocylindria bacterium]|jgi:hypothetical protein|nr:hypothetical protein [Candidatus Limnocylindria bacterium]
MLKRLFVFQALVDVLYGIPLILATGTLLSIYGLSTDGTGTYIAQFLGGAFLALAWISWSARDLPDGDIQRAIVRASLVGAAVGFVASLVFLLGPNATTMVWLNIALTGILVAGWGYLSYATMRPMTRPQPA